jgi:hypothetical protein
MEDIDKEIQEKVIEKQPQPAPEIKPKKPRSEAQKAAFEKARAKRLENIKKREEEEISKIDPDTLEVKEEKPPPVKRGRGRPKGSTKAKKQADPRNYPKPVNNPVYQPVNHGIPFNNNQPQNYYAYDPRPIQPPPHAVAPAPVNNYYYYGTDQRPRPPTPPQEKKVVIITDSDSSEEEIYYESTKPDTRYAPVPEPPRTTMKYRFS